MTKYQQQRIDEIKKTYGWYKVQNIAIQLVLHDVKDEDIAYIMQDGEKYQATPTVYKEVFMWFNTAMGKMEERLGKEFSAKIRQDSACCLKGVRDTLAKQIRKTYPTVEQRFEALDKEKRIIGGKAYKEGNSYYVSYWYDVPQGGYTCACLHHVDKENAMHKLWCECCVGHIKHHFETAIGVKTKCELITSVVSSKGQKPCTFKFDILEEAK